jgi:hypothetical protein
MKVKKEDKLMRRPDNANRSSGAATPFALAIPSMAANVAATEDEMSGKKHDLTEYLKRRDGPKLGGGTTDYQTATPSITETPYETTVHEIGQPDRKISDSKQDTGTEYIPDTKFD